MVCVYKKKNYVIYSNKEGFIIHNRNKEFQSGHSHISNFNTAKYLIDMAIYSRIPNRKSIYFLESLIRISNDPDYIKKLRALKGKLESVKSYSRKNTSKKQSTKVFIKERRI